MNEQIENTQTEVMEKAENHIIQVGELKMSPQCEKIFVGLAKFLQQVKQPEKAGLNKHTQAKYVKIEATIAAINAGIKGTGLSYTTVGITQDGITGVQTVIMHESGQFMIYPVVGFKASTVKPHDIGSFLTYARRYSLSSAFNLASDEDDDGSNAQNVTTGNQNDEAAKPAGIDRTEMLADIAMAIDEIAELTGKPIKDIRNGLLDKVGEKSTFEEYQGTQLGTARAIVKRSLELVKQRPKQEAAKKAQEAEKDALVDKAVEQKNSK